MKELSVRIVQLDPMLIASASGYGESPEPIAWDKILNWANSEGLLGRDKDVRFFGFNNPDPSPGTPNYGYEQWMTVPQNVSGDDEITVKDFSGGLYAVAHCESLVVIGERWKQLVAWREDSVYHQAHHQWLEELLSPPDTPHEQLVFDLYLPIAE
ncbi:MAG: hypothetical protein BMS9Abin02_0680 [Anaerolineae bacterium]|nr:MAG: hypothetical protein BMS9Abin02_0680 [Anaerolineae bacterium]